MLKCISAQRNTMQRIPKCDAFFMNFLPRKHITFTRLPVVHICGYCTIVGSRYAGYSGPMPQGLCLQNLVERGHNHRSFRTKGAETASGKTKQTTTVASEEDISAVVSQLISKYKLGPKEAVGIRFGIQEGMRMQNTDVKDGRNLRMLYVFAVAAGIIAALFFWSTSSDLAIKKIVSINKKDFKAEVPDVSFDDVKGINEVKQELLDVVEFLRDPDRFTNLGGKLPKGMLLIGPPGTGKTLLARAIAGEAGVPFFYASGSEFDEMFVGVGSARIRSLFAEARENAPCIIFIDEIDACGNKRTSSPLQPYARQTINQLLQEMDGFEAKEGVIVLGATNMAGVLDKALTRPGRFDTEITVLPPDITGRKEILELYMNKVVKGKDLDVERIACLTGGMTGADLANLVNQAALQAAQQRKNAVEMEDLEYALDKLRLGPELKSRVRTEKELEITAFHEAGHALVAYHTPNTMPIFKATLRQRGAALGHVSFVPTREDENNETRAKLLARIDIAMGGRVAEEIMQGADKVTTGGASDLEAATRIAYKLVCDFGMSETLGFVAYDFEKVSPQNKSNIESEVNLILETSYKKAKEVLTRHSEQHKLLAKALLKYETLSLEEIKALLSSNTTDAIDRLRSNL